MGGVHHNERPDMSRTERPPECYIAEAKAGSERAAADLITYAWNEWGVHMCRFLFSYDIAEDEDDLRQIFMLGAFQAIPHLDERGDPMHHLAKRGWWAVRSNNRRGLKWRDTKSLDVEEGPDQVSSVPDTQEDMEEIVIRQMGAMQTAHAIRDLPMAPIGERIIDAVLEGKAGDPTEIGFGRRLSAAINVSPQRASQGMNTIRKAVEKAGITSEC